jgi:hypothetical protein
LPSPLEHDPFDLSQLVRRESARLAKNNFAQPELCQHSLALNMNVGRLVPFVAVKEEAVGPHASDDWHAARVYPTGSAASPNVIAAGE